MPQAIPFILKAVAFIKASSIASAVIKGIISVGLSVLAQSLRKTPKSGGASASDSTFMVRQPAFPRRVVYGRARVGGIWFYANVTGSKGEYLHLVMGICEGPIEEIEGVLFGDELVTLDANGNATGKYSGYVRVREHLGGDLVADSDLVAEDTNWTANHKLLGIAYVYLRLKHSTKIFEGGLPDISFVVKGRNDIYDPRTTSSGYSRNSALCWAHYLQIQNIGPGIPSTDFDEDYLIAAANVCDENVSLKAGGTEKRYEVDGTFSTAEDPEGVLDSIEMSMAGWRVESGGKFRVFAGEYTVPTNTITVDQILGPIEHSSKQPRRQRVNKVKGLFRSEGNNWQPYDFPPQTSAVYETSDGQELVRDIDLDFTISPSRAQRLAKIVLERARLERRLTVVCDLSAFRISGGENILVTIPRYGYTNKPFHVEEISLSTTRSAPSLTLSLSEIDSSIYDWDHTTEEVELVLPAVLSGSAPALDVSLAPPPPGPISRVAKFEPYGFTIPYLFRGYTFGADFTLAFWCRLDTGSRSDDVIMYNSNASTVFVIRSAYGTAKKIHAEVHTSGGIVRVGEALTDPPEEEWLLVVFKIDYTGTSSTIDIRSIESAYSQTATVTTTGVNTDATATLGIGTDITDHFRGAIGPIGIWSKIFTGTQITDYLSDGLQLYSQLSSDNLTSLVAYWNMNEVTGTREDSHGSGDLTQGNAVGCVLGPPTDFPIDVEISSNGDDAEIYYKDAFFNASDPADAQTKATGYDETFISVGRGEALFAQAYSEDLKSETEGGIYGFDLALDVTATALLHLDASLGIFADANKVERWESQLGSVEAEQATVANQPELFLNQVNGHPAVYFDGTNDFMTIPQLASGTTKFTIVAVWKSIDTDVEDLDRNHLLDMQDGSVSDQAYVVTAKRNAAVLTNGGVRPYQADIEPSTWVLTNWYFADNGLLDGDNLCFVDGVKKARSTDGAVSRTVNIDSTTNMILGKSNWATGSEFKGYIAELMIFSGFVSSANKAILDRFLKNKYDIQ